MNRKKIRNSNIELLRIISILMIIAGHYYVHGGFSDVSPFNECVLKIFGGCAKIGVACFVLITGYFGDKIKPGRVVYLIKDRWVYSLISNFGFVINWCH